MRKRLLGIALLVLGAILLLLSFRYTEKRATSLTCNGLRVRIADSSRLAFVTPRRVERYLRKHIGELRGRSLAAIDTHHVESLLDSLPAVRSAQVYTDCSGTLNVELRQRQPIARAIAQNGESCYIDDAGHRFVLDSLYAAHVLVISGAINLPPRHGCALPVSDSVTPSLWQQLFALSQYIHRSREWKPLFTQIYVASPQRVELIPRVGGFVINLGSPDNYAYKLDKLRSMYRANLPGEGLDAYSEINLAFSDQVVCTKREMSTNHGG